MVYQITPTHYQTGFTTTKEWKKSNALYDAYKKTTTPFEVVLIGLDGGVKLRQTLVLSCQKLFGTIDVMPMRRAEMRHRDSGQ